MGAVRSLMALVNRVLGVGGAEGLLLVLERSVKDMLVMVDIND